MRHLKATDCAILPLVLKKKWYAMIASGEKKEEYREAKPYWQKRISKWLASEKDYHVVAFSLGYKKADMFFLIKKIDIFSQSKCYLKTEWGEEEGAHYTIQLSERVILD